MLKNTFLFTLLLMFAAGLHATDTLHNGPALMADIDSSGNAALVTGNEDSSQLVFFPNGKGHSWEVELDRIPKEVSVLPGGRVLLLERGNLLTETRENNRVEIYSSKGLAWKAPGLAYNATWSPKHQRFLVKTILGDEHLLQAYTHEGVLELEMPLPSTAAGDEREVTFSSDGMAVFLSPTEHYGVGNMELHPLNGETPFVVNLGPEIKVHRAFALSDSEIVFVGSDGALRKLNKQGVVFEIHGKNKPFRDLEASPDGLYALARRSFNRFDVYNTATGENLWHVDARSNHQKLAKELNLDALPAFNGQSQEARSSFLVGLYASIQDGGITLVDRKSGQQFWIGDPTNVTESLMVGYARGTSLSAKANTPWQLRLINGQIVREQLPLSASIR